MPELVRLHEAVNSSFLWTNHIACYIDDMSMLLTNELDCYSSGCLVLYFSPNSNLESCNITTWLVLTFHPKLIETSFFPNKNYIVNLFFNMNFVLLFVAVKLFFS